MRCNVDLLKIIQIGITLSDANGNMPDGTCTWQFNFHFSVNDDMYSADSIENLQKAGLDFSRHEDPQYGIKPNDFAELLITSGLVIFENVKWISFHSGYDFGYLLRLLTNAPLPSVEEDFFELFITRSIRATKGGLQEIADELGVQRIGPLQQAGSDALLTSMTFFKMKEHYFPDQFDESKYSGQLYGLGPNYNPLASSPSAPTPAHVHHTAVSHNMNISLPGMGMQMNGMNSMGMGQPFPTPGLYPTGSVGTPFGPSGPTPPTHGGGMSGMGMGGVGMYGMPGHNVR
ncbi:CCR4-Not complex component, Not1 [Rhizoctonia solani]|uniref:CCR4-Not complex component, Not1 n=1 Tax=Rhizoctonia solani TaxID=456999 RepID=A0A8H8T2I1_9AGAM|nr:CCR4-Not complex component, Not1 [Rhizoctonia solani]QRW27521.1 CCR4-Not complex component, Not1 [Rhizoctonia solani]